MKQLESKFPRFTTPRFVVVLLVAAIWGGSTECAFAQDTPTPTPTPSQAAPDEVDLLTRLNNLEQRLNKVDTADLDPISLLLPNVSSNVPNAYGASQGMVAVGAGYQNRTRFSDNNDDGAISAVLGLGNPRKLGVDVQGSFLDLSRFGHRVALGFKIHRQFNNDFAVAFGAENALISARSDSDHSYYLVVSKKLRVKENSSQQFSRLYLSAGLGNGRFLSEGDVFNNRGGINVFGSAAININRSSMLFTEWTGQSLNVGTSVVPFRKYPFALTLTLADIAGGGGDGSRATIGIGYVFPR